MAMSVTDSVKWILAVAVIGVGFVVDNVYLGESLLYRVLAMLGFFMVAAYVAAGTTQGRNLIVLAREARMEIRRVVWPTSQETMQTTLLVLGFVLLTALLLWGLDALFGWLASFALG